MTMPLRFQNVFEAVTPLLPAVLSISFYAGMVGEVALTTNAPRLFVQITGLVIPGLRSLGIASELLPLPLETKQRQNLLASLLEKKAALLVFLLSTEVWKPELPDADGPFPSPPPEPEILQSFLLIDESLLAATEKPSYVLSLSRAATKGERTANRRDVLLRWITFADAFPEHTLSDSDADNDARSNAAAFLSELAGKERTRPKTLLRRAAAACENSDTRQMLQCLRESVLPELHLPTSAENALLSPPDRSLSDSVRRELLYLARAGTESVRVLAARRLQTVRAFPDVQRTLEMLACAPEPFVRAAARNNMPAISDKYL